MTVRSVTSYRDHSYVEFEQALLASGKRGTHDLVGMAEVWADMHDGMVLSRDLATALRAMNFSRSSMDESCLRLLGQEDDEFAAAS